MILNLKSAIIKILLCLTGVSYTAHGNKSEIVLYKTKDSDIKLEVNIKDDSVWLNRTQMAELFDRDVKTIGKHINNALREELVGIPTVAKFATVGTEGVRLVERDIEYYNFDVIISVGYRVKSQRGVDFRRWANSVLKDYIIKGHAVNADRLKQLGKIVKILKQADSRLDARQVLSVIERYTTALDLLDGYDHQRIQKPKGSQAVYVLSYEECKTVINNMKFNAESDLFGNEKDDSFKASIGAIYQTFSGTDIYPTLEEKAANLLYFVTKNHSFTDGNKRIAATMFLYFLDKNHALVDEYDNKIIEDHTLVALTIMIAESKPDEKELLISLIMNFIVS